MDEQLTIEYVHVDDLRANESNPNEMDDRTFNALCLSIQEEGWTEPIQVVYVEADQVYEIVGGHHRWEAAKVLGFETVPCVKLDPEKFDQDRRDWNLVKLNILRGKLNPEKFTTLYRRLTEVYDAEVMQSLMGFTTEEAFKKVYRDVTRALPPELRAAMEDAKDEIKTIDDLSLVLNRLFAEHGETLPSNMMVFSWGGKEVLWIRCDDDAWETLAGSARRLGDAGEDVAAAFARFVAAHEEAMA